MLLLTLSLFIGCAQSTINAETKEINSFQDCVDAGNKVLRSYPGQCVTADGKRFVEEIKKRKAAICVDNCGNGTCEEMVCMGQGCPCAENKNNCKLDCK